MNSKLQFLSAGLFCAMSLSALAQSDIAQTSRSLGKLVSDDSIVLSTAVKSQTIVENPLRALSEYNDSVQRDIANRHDQHFWIYSADVELISDLDGDGFHHALNVIFDVDVDYDGATVYAKLYLSREGGPWIQYSTSDLYEIYEDEVSDAYEVTTELVEGYPPGYYAVLIEVYSLNHGDMVASEIFDHHNLGKDIMLEDLSRDEVIVYEEVEVVTEHGGGSFSLLIWLLLVQVVIAARGALTLSPRKTIIRRIGTSALRSFFRTRVTMPYSTR
jgi:hypothetical protein